MDTSPCKGVLSKEIVTVAELAELLQVPRSWIYGRTRSAERTGFPLIRCGKYIRLVPAEVLDFIRDKGNHSKD